jgi:hypothetical protein
MQLLGEELNLFVAACGDMENNHAQELLNVFGAEQPAEVFLQMRHAPLGVFVDVVSHVWYAIIYEAGRRDPAWGEVLERMYGC